jgi:hypothetical protein
MKESACPVKHKKMGGTVLPEFLGFTCHCMQLILGNVSIFKSTLLPSAHQFTVTAWMWNFTFYTAEHK